MLDLLIAGGAIIDGTGAPGVRADLGVQDGRIAAIGDLADAEAARRIDTTGLVVAPGFIDTHAHSDAALLLDPQHANGLRQGITTEIITQDGLSYAPLSPEGYRQYRHFLAGLLGLPPLDIDVSSMAAFLANYHRRVAINVVALVPHGPVRLAVTGFRDAPLRGESLDQATRLVREGMEQGARGFSTGLSYYPNAYSDTDELIAINRIVAGMGGVYVTHLRDHETDRAFGGGGVTEALEIGRRTGVKVHFSHYRTWPHNAGKVDALMEEIDRAKAEGVDVSLETYPYPVGSTFPAIFFPGEFSEGGPEAILRRLEDPIERARWSRYADETWGAPLGLHVWSHIGDERHRGLEGRSFGSLARERGMTVGEMLCSVMLETGLTCGMHESSPDDLAAWRQVEADIMTLLDRDDYMVGSDAIPVGGMPHPRAHGTFPRVVGRLRRRHARPLEQVIQRITQNPAVRFGLDSRGVLAVGAHADVVIFDPERINDQATFEDPCIHPAGIPYVVVNGRLAVDGERCTGVLAGEAL